MAVDPRSLNLASLEQQYQLPQGLLSSVMHQESRGNPNAVSPAGAQGLFQFMPSTAKAYGINPFDPLESAVGAARMYGDLSKQFKGDVPSMLAAYNWGSGNLADNGLENAPQETKDYISKVTAGMGREFTEIVPTANETSMQITPEMAKAELARRQGITPEMARAELGKRKGSPLQKFGKELGRQAGLTGRIIGEGLGQIGDLPNLAVNAGIGGLNALGADIKPLQYPSQMVGEGLTKLGVPQPENGLERVVQDAGKALVSTGATMGLAGASNIPALKPLAENAAVQAKSALGSSVASGSTREAGGGPLAQVAAGLAGGAAATALSIPKKRIYTSDDVRKFAGEAYKRADDLGGAIKPEYASKIVDDIAESLPQDRASVLLEGDSPARQLLADVRKLTEKPITLTEAQSIDRVIGERVSKFILPNGKPDADGRQLLQIQNSFRDAIENSGEDALIGGKAGFNAWKQGRQLWSKSIKLGDVERILTKADGADNPTTIIKNGFAAWKNNPKRFNGLSSAEKQAVRNAAKTGVVSQMLRLPGSRIIPIVGLGTGNVGGAIATGIGGVASRSARDALQASRAAKVAETIAGSAPRDIFPILEAGTVGTAQGVKQSQLNKTAKKFDRKVTKITIRPEQKLPEVNLPQL